MALQTGESVSPGGISDSDGRQVVTLSASSGKPVVAGATATLAGGAGTPTAGGSAQLVAANASRRGLQVVVDTAAGGTVYVYLLLGAGTASATSFHVALGAGGSWDGLVGGQLWTGAVQFFSAGTPKVGVAEV